MNWKGNIEELKNKFWEGNTSLEEEKILKDYYSDVENDDNIDAIYFQFIADEKGIQYEPKRKIKIFQMFKRNIVTIAASMAILVISLFAFNKMNQKPDVYVASSPEEALLITQNALAYINSQVQHGNSMVFTNLNEFEKINFFK